MAVKDLVSLFERSSNPSQAQRQQASLPLLESPHLTHDHDTHNDSNASIMSIDDYEDTTAVNDSNDFDDLSNTLDITEEYKPHTPINDSKLFEDSETVTTARVGSGEQDKLVKSPLLLNDEIDNGSGILSPYDVDVRSRKLTKPSSDRPHFSTHTPVPATVLFSRQAVPLHLPNLDSYLEALPPPTLETYGAAKEGAPGTGMFPPMDRLAQSGKSIDDLESNKTPTPAWRNKSSIFGALMTAALGITGSSAVATFYSLQGLANTVQIFALIMNTIVSVKSKKVWSQWQKVIFGTIPNIIALNFASTLIQNLIFLLIFMTLASILLYIFYRATWPSPGDSSTASAERYNSTEGLIRPQPISTARQWVLVLVSFLLTSIYLPLSTMAVHVLVWSEDLWVIPPSLLGADMSPVVAMTNEDHQNICWTTTMKRNEINWAPAFIVVAALVFIFLTLWFPYMLRQVIKQSVPKVDMYTDLGRKRNSVDMDNEYRRLLNRDQNPFNFLYSGFRRGYGTYISTYLIAKLSALIIVAVISPTNCLFRTFSFNGVLIARQVLLLVCTIIWFSVQCWVTPFLDPVGNAGEWISRLNYILTAAVALAVLLTGENGVLGRILDTYVLYAVYIITYGLTIYFAIIRFGFARRIVKKLARRIDFSIDIFSPRLDLSPNAIHVKRRIWQESITTLLLTNPECAIPQSQPMAFVQARDSEYPPYLHQFSGSPGERHVENLKILREVGLPTYSKAIALASGPDAMYHEALHQEIQTHYTGPDCYWRDPRKEHIPGCTKYFGNAWWIPFPPTLAIRYDDGPLAVLSEAHEFREYIEQNASNKIHRRREIRLSLRALEGQKVRWPYKHTAPIGSQSLWCCSRHYHARTSTRYMHATLEIVRRGYCPWQDKQLGSGFEVQLRYTKNLVVGSTVFGLNEDYDLTPPLAHFLALNRHLIAARIHHLESAINGYREHHRAEYKKKRDVMSYQFLTNVYNRPRDPTKIAESAMSYERDLRVRRLLVGSKDVFQIASRRMKTVTRSPACVWWYIFWDDLWRRNHDTIGGLELYATDFNPHYPSSIAYSPLPRPALESFLIQRGLMSNKPKWSDFFHHGFLNKLYFRLNDAVFTGSKSTAILFHIGDRPSELLMEEIDKLTQGQPSTFLGTGGGTDHDADSIRARPAYHWEGLLSDPYVAGRTHRRRWFAKMGAWFGVTPLWRSGVPSHGISLDVRLEQIDESRKRYVLLDNAVIN